MKKQKKSAYWVVDVHGGWGVACCVEAESGYHPVDGYGPYAGDEGQKHAQGIVDRLNERLGHGPPDSAGHKLAVRRIVGSTMPTAK
jgi:hypothetical protein